MLPGDPGVTAKDNRLFVNAVLWILKIVAPRRNPTDARTAGRHHNGGELVGRLRTGGGDPRQGLRQCRLSGTIPRDWADVPPDPSDSLRDRQVRFALPDAGYTIEPLYAFGPAHVRTSGRCYFLFGVVMGAGTSARRS